MNNVCILTAYTDKGADTEAGTPVTGILRRKAKKVLNPFSTDVILTIQNMKRLALEWEAKNKVRCEGLAANQIGSLLRIIILRKTDVMAPPKPDPNEYFPSDGSKDNDSETLRKFNRANEIYRSWTHRLGSFYDPWHVLINPQIIEKLGSQDSIEGCLSIPQCRTFTKKRPTLVVFKYTDAKGRIVGPQVIKGSGAAALMHEVDHLDGKLIDDLREDEREQIIVEGTL